ncbi:RNA polymerase sigma factor [Paenibacillus sp. J22TS3]|uniref:RNA polymerase sigma factor n=1 Tax=Paenibacillus sp. J22TS3 TaxID=2807192 RepID=UPI001B0A915A|nr:sigma-70 family RNA polymerase sigma factor [Paenibacillus sp. J22TS3]GIP24322.1 DNA-directed RNA polymerase sigma-70 factor [Paenibacillus sp. J22TS3]
MWNEHNLTRQDDERKWISRVLDGHTEEYAFLVNLYKNKIYGLLRGMGADHQDAQDLAQETFIKAYRNLASHDRSRSFAAWLYTIAANLLRDFRRKTPYIEHRVENYAHLSAGANPEEILLKGENLNELQEVLRQLPANYRMVILLRYTNDLTYEEMSEVLGVPMNKVQNDLYRAKKRLKQLLTSQEARNDAVFKSR